MGLTIHFTLTASRHDAAQARAAVETMRQAALASYLVEVSDLFHEVKPADDHDERFGAMYPGRRLVETGRPLRPQEEPAEPRKPMSNDELLAEAEAMVEAVERRFDQIDMALEGLDDAPVDHDRWQVEIVQLTDGAYVDIDPLESFWFVAQSKGSEPLVIGLARYPATVDHTPADGEPVTLETGLGIGWHWQGFCKTQYASMPEYGGDEHFIQTHAAVCDVLAAAVPAGVHTDVHDESRFYQTRDRQALLDTVGDWNRMTAAVAGQLKDDGGKLLNDRDVVGPILRHPNFEHLEAEGERVFERRRRHHRSNTPPAEGEAGQR